MPSIGRQHKHRDSEPASPLPRRWINDVELAGYLGVSVATTRRWRLHHTGPPFTKIGSSVRYALDEVDLWVAKQPRGGSVEPAA